MGVRRNCSFELVGMCEKKHFCLLAFFSACEDDRDWDLRLWKYHCGRGGLYC